MNTKDTIETSGCSEQEEAQVVQDEGEHDKEEGLLSQSSD